MPVMTETLYVALPGGNLGCIEQCGNERLRHTGEHLVVAPRTRATAHRGDDPQASLRHAQGDPRYRGGAEDHRGRCARLLDRASEGIRGQGWRQDFYPDLRRSPVTLEAWRRQLPTRARLLILERRSQRWSWA